MASKKQTQKKDLKTALSKDISTKNPIFSPAHIEELHSMFSLYADPRQKRADIRDVLITAKTLALDQKYEIVFRALQDIANQSGGDAMDFETFLRDLTAKIGNPFNQEGRQANFTLLDVQQKGELDLNDLRYVSEQLRYNFTDDEITEIIHQVGGYGAETVTWDRFNRYIQKRVDKKRTG